LLVFGAVLAAFILFGCAQAREPALDLLPEVSETVEPRDARTLLIALDLCDEVHATTVREASDLGVLEGAALERGSCFHTAADTSIAVFESDGGEDTGEFTQELLQALEAYRTTYRDLCEFIVLGSANPWGIEGQVSSANCEAEAELKAASLVAAWGFTLDAEPSAAIDVAKRHGPCYVAFNQAMSVAVSQIDMQRAHLSKWACVSDLARANRAVVIEAAKGNVNGFDARYVQEDFDAVVEATDQTNSALCSLFVEHVEDPRSAWTAIDRAACGTDAEVLRDDLFVTIVSSR
jgi:hypothetical protein